MERYTDERDFKIQLFSAQIDCYNGFNDEIGDFMKKILELEMS